VGKNILTMNKKLFDQKFWNEYGEEIYSRESAQNQIKPKARDERAGDYGKRGKKEHIRSLRKNKWSKRGDV
jgi:hypothetical protein